MTPLHEPNFRRSRISDAVRAYAAQSREERLARERRRKLIQTRILSLHDKFAQIRMNEIRAGLPLVGYLSPLDSRNLNSLTAMILPEEAKT